MTTEKLNTLKGFASAATVAKLRDELAEVREWDQQMVPKSAKGNNLAGYRELGKKCAELESRLKRVQDIAKKAVDYSSIDDNPMRANQRNINALRSIAAAEAQESA